jgi:Protein of unknown function with HXXEE motif
MTAWVTWGLFLAWLLHDIEELITMPGWGGRNAARLSRLYPSAPDWLWSRMDMSRTHVTVAITVMSLFMLAAAADGASSAGTSWFYQAVLIGFGIHGIGHLGMRALARSYPPGVLTAPIIVIPFSLWAWCTLENAGAVSAGTSNLFVALALLPTVILSSNALTIVLLWTLRTLPRRH